MTVSLKYSLTQIWRNMDALKLPLFPSFSRKQDLLFVLTVLLSLFFEAPKNATMPLILTTEGDDLPSAVRAWIPWHMDLCLKKSTNMTTTLTRVLFAT